jgi:hypothetical protein
MAIKIRLYGTDGALAYSFAVNDTAAMVNLFGAVWPVIANQGNLLIGAAAEQTVHPIIDIKVTLADE